MLQTLLLHITLDLSWHDNVVNVGMSIQILRHTSCMGTRKQAEEDRKLRLKLREIRIKGEVLDGVKISKGRIDGHVMGEWMVMSSTTPPLDWLMGFQRNVYKMG